MLHFEIMKIKIWEKKFELLFMICYYNVLLDTTHGKILGSETFVRWLVSLVLALGLKIALMLTIALALVLGS